MSDSSHQNRIRDLQEHLDLVCNLLSDIERAKMLSNDPTDKMRYDTQIAEKKQQKAAFEQELRDLGIPDPRPSILPLPANPYRGLAAFRAEDQANFFGREQVAQDLKKLVERHHFVALIGASGSGKSSLLSAGLKPLLENSWLVLEFRPKLKPFYELSRSVVLARYDEGIAQDEAFTELPEKLAQQKIELGVLLDAARSKHEKARLLLIADQFEELYTQTEASVQFAFVQCLLNAVQFADAHDAPLTILFSYRADFTGFAIASFGSLLNQQGKLFLDRMSQAELERAIAEPALRAGVALEAGLLSRILEDVGQEAGRLPLLQFTLMQLWTQQTNRCLTHQAYEAIGGIEQALTTYANQALAEFDTDEQSRIRQIFMQLVRFGEGMEDTRQVATQSHIADWALVKRLADKRLIVTGQDVDMQQTVEVVHEALIRHWQPLQVWIQTDRAFRLWQEGLRRDMQDNALLRDARLAVAREWLQQRELELPEVEQAFIRASIAQFEAEQAEKLRQRRRWTVFVMVFFVVALGLSGLAGWKWWESEYNLSEAQKNFARSEENLTLSKRNQSLMLTGLAEIELKKDHPATAMRLALEALPESSETYPNRPFVAEAQDFLTRAINRQYQGVLEQHARKMDVPQALFSPDGQKILTTSGKQVNVWNTYSRQLIFTLQGHAGLINSVRFSPDGTKIISASDDKTARIWDSNTGKLLLILQGHSASVKTACFSHDAMKIVTASTDMTAQVWDSKTGESLAMLQGHSKEVLSANFSPDGTKIITASADETTRVWNSSTSQFEFMFNSDVKSASFSPDGTKIVTATNNDSGIWDSSTGKHITTLDGHSVLFGVESFSPDGARIVTSSPNGSAYVWDSNTGKLLLTLQGHLARVVSASFNSDGTKIVTSSWDRTVRVWDSSTGESLAIYKEHLADVNSAIFSPDGMKVLSIEWNNTVRIWNSNSGRNLAVFLGHSNDVNSGSFSPDGNKIVTASNDKTARVWDNNTGRYLILEGHSGAVMSASFSPDGSKIVTGSDDHHVVVWDANTGKSLETLYGHLGQVLSASFSPDGTKILTAAWDNTAVVWDSNSGHPLVVLRGDSVCGDLCITSARFSPDGKKFVTSSYLGENVTVIVWENKTSKYFTVLKKEGGHSDSVASADFSPDGRKIVTASLDKTARIWDINTGKSLIVLKGHSEKIRSASFSPDGKKIVTASLDKTARIWDSSTGESLSVIQGHSEGVHSASFSPDGTKLVTTSVDNKAHIWLTFPTLEATVAYAKTLLTPRDTGEKGEEKLENFRLTCAERQRFFLDEIERCKDVSN